MYYQYINCLFVHGPTFASPEPLSLDHPSSFGPSKGTSMLSLPFAWHIGITKALFRKSSCEIAYVFYSAVCANILPCISTANDQRLPTPSSCPWTPQCPLNNPYPHRPPISLNRLPLSSGYPPFSAAHMPFVLLAYKYVYIALIFAGMTPRYFSPPTTALWIILVPFSMTLHIQNDPTGHSHRRRHVLPEEFLHKTPRSRFLWLVVGCGSSSDP